MVCVCECNPEPAECGLQRAQSTCYEETFGGEMLTRILGRTGESVSAIGLGGAHIGTPELTSREAVRIIRTALDRGLNFMDNSWDYIGESPVEASMNCSRQHLILTPPHRIPSG